jgi:hypothetical protein
MTPLESIKIEEENREIILDLEDRSVTLEPDENRTFEIEE